MAHKSDDDLITLGVSLLLSTVMLYAMGVLFWRYLNANTSTIVYPSIPTSVTSEEELLHRFRLGDRRPSSVLVPSSPDPIG